MHPLPVPCPSADGLPEEPQDVRPPKAAITAESPTWATDAQEIGYALREVGTGYGFHVPVSMACQKNDKLLSGR